MSEQQGLSWFELIDNVGKHNKDDNNLKNVEQELIFSQHSSKISSNSTRVKLS